MTIQQFFDDLRLNPIVNDYIEYMKDTLKGGYINYYFEDGGQHYSGAPLPEFKYHNIKGNLHPVVWGGKIKTNMIQHLFGSTEVLFRGYCVFGEYTGSISAGSYGSRQGFIRPYMKSKDSDRDEQWQYVCSLRTGKKFLGSKYWTPANPETKMSFYQYLGLDKSAVRVVQKESQKILTEALKKLIDAIQTDEKYLAWKESDNLGDNADDATAKLDLKKVYSEIVSSVGRLRLDQETDDEIQCSIRDWGNWDHDYEDSDRDDDDYEDDDYEILSDASYLKMNKIIDEIKDKFPQADIDWGTSEKNWIDFTITRMANESKVEEIKTSMISGTSGRTIDSLEDRKYELKKDVKDAQIGNYVNITLPKGTIIYNLPGGVHADHKSLKRYADRNNNIYFEKPTFSGIRVRSKPELLADIEKNSKVLENKEIINEASYGGNEIYEIATPAPKAMLKEELEELFGDDYRNIVTEFNSPEGLESVLMFNISKNDISKIAENIGDVLVFKLQLGGRKSII